jgi:transcription factor TFIIIB component B''
MLGTDFSLMESIFPRRTRFELKRKFKMEEKINRALIDKTIGTQKPFDATVFGDESGMLKLLRISDIT